MPGVEHIVAVITEDTERVALMQHSFDQIASNIRVVRVVDANGVMQLQRSTDDAAWEPRPVPHLIFLDAWPGQQSLDALQKLRSVDAPAEARIIVLCRADADTDVAQAYGLGADSCLTVSTDPDQFVAMMKEAGRYWLLLNRWPTW